MIIQRKSTKKKPKYKWQIMSHFTWAIFAFKTNIRMNVQVNWLQMNIFAVILKRKCWEKERLDSKYHVFLWILSRFFMLAAINIKNRFFLLFCIFFLLHSLIWQSYWCLSFVVSSLVQKNILLRSGLTFKQKHKQSINMHSTNE